MTAVVNGTEVVLAVAILILLVASGLLAMAETALVRMNKAKAKSLADDGRHGAHDLVELVEHPQRFLNPVLLCILVCQLISATLIGVLAERFFGPWGIAAATVFEVVVIFVVFEAVPKNWAVHHPERAALLMAPLVKAVIAFPPVRWISSVLIGLANVLIGHSEDGAKGSLVTESELLAMADVAADDNVIEGAERDYIGQLIEFGDTVVREVMVPRPDMVTLDAEVTVTEALREALAAGFSRMPVCRESVDDVIGVAITKDLIRAEHLGHGDDLVDAHLREARFLPETKNLSSTMREMQAKRFHLAVVVDEFGSTAGLVTLEDLIEELIGEITDEFDEDQQDDFNRDDSGVVRVAGRLNLEDLDELLGTRFPEGSWDTVAGLVLDVAGRVPKVGESVDVHGYRLTVERLKGRRIDLVRIDALEDDADA
jgi:CBS domain containing-hemolysin-like protein